MLQEWKLTWLQTSYLVCYTAQYCVLSAENWNMVSVHQKSSSLFIPDYRMTKTSPDQLNKKKNAETNGWPL